MTSLKKKLRVIIFEFLFAVLLLEGTGDAIHLENHLYSPGDPYTLRCNNRQPASWNILVSYLQPQQAYRLHLGAAAEGHAQWGFRPQFSSCSSVVVLSPQLFRSCRHTLCMSGLFHVKFGYTSLVFTIQEANRYRWTKDNVTLNATSQSNNNNLELVLNNETMGVYRCHEVSDGENTLVSITYFLSGSKLHLPLI